MVKGTLVRGAILAVLVVVAIVASHALRGQRPECSEHPFFLLIGTAYDCQAMRR
jgi:hypothetical protein